jgi:hypothetical protein
MAIKKIKNGNIFTAMIADMLDVSDSVALRVHNYIDENYNLDWSEADEDEIKFYAFMAFEDLNEEVPAEFYM